MKTPNPRCFGVWRAIGKKVEAEKPNRFSAKCAIAHVDLDPDPDLGIYSPGL
jgi:hypothetical protein